MHIKYHFSPSAAKILSKNEVMDARVAVFFLQRNERSLHHCSIFWKDDPVGELLKVASQSSYVRKTNADIDNG